MKCKACGGTGRMQMVTLVKGADFPCIECNGTGEVELTNFEFMQSCTMEEEAELLDKIMQACGGCPQKSNVREWLTEKYHAES